jgi:diacylglycerol kinase (ATP)
MRLTLTLADGTEHVVEQPVTLIALANTALFGGGLRICPTADPRDGVLDLVVVGALGRAELVRWLPRVFRGTHMGHPALRAHRVTSMTIESDEAIRADGEPFAPAGAPLHVRVEPAALRVVV